MKTAEPFSYKPPMTAVRSGIKYENESIPSRCYFFFLSSIIRAWIP